MSQRDAATTPVRGFSLIFVVSMLAVLSFGATLLLARASGVGLTAGSRSQAISADNVAKAGAALASRSLEALVYPGGTSSLNLAALANLRPLSRGDVLCADGVDCSQWLLLSGAQAVGSQSAVVRMAVTCNPGGCNVAPDALVNFQVRVQGVLRDQPTSVLEVTLAPNEL